MKKLIAFSIAVGALALQRVPAQAQPTTVYTTTEDFGLPSSTTGSLGTMAPSTVWDYDGSTVNGAANATPSGTGTAGSIAFTPTGTGALGWGSLGDLYIGNFTSSRVALDPGYTAGPPSVFPAAEGTITMVYTLPDNNSAGAGTYYQPMLGFNAAWGWGLNGPDSTEDLGLVGGLQTYRGTWSYSIPETVDGWGVNLMIGANTDYAPAEPFYFDTIVVTEASVVPEPTTMALLGMGALTAILALRSRRAH